MASTHRVTSREKPLRPTNNHDGCSKGTATSSRAQRVATKDGCINFFRSLVTPGGADIKSFDNYQNAKFNVLVDQWRNARHFALDADELKIVLHGVTSAFQRTPNRDHITAALSASEGLAAWCVTATQHLNHYGLSALITIANACAFLTRSGITHHDAAAQNNYDVFTDRLSARLGTITRDPKITEKERAGALKAINGLHSQKPARPDTDAATDANNTATFG